jgi:hypothetical protein
MDRKRVEVRFHTGSLDREEGGTTERTRACCLADQFVQHPVSANRQNSTSIVGNDVYKAKKKSVVVLRVEQEVSLL